MSGVSLQDVPQVAAGLQHSSSASVAKCSAQPASLFFPWTGAMYQGKFIFICMSLRFFFSKTLECYRLNWKGSRRKTVSMLYWVARSGKELLTFLWGVFFSLCFFALFVVYQRGLKRPKVHDVICFNKYLLLKCKHLT